MIGNLLKILKGLSLRYPRLHMVIAPFFRPLTSYVYQKERKRKNKIFQEYALEALTLFDDSMRRAGVEYTLAFGSILGAIREHGFIKHDLDIDTAVWIDDFTPSIIQELEKAGFVWVFEHMVDEGKLGREDTFEYRGVRIDIFYLYPPINQYPYCCDFLYEDGMKENQRLPRRIEVPFSRERRKVPFENIEVYVPANAEEFCAFRYGPDYMVPNPSWSWIEEHDALVEWREKIDVTSNRKYPHGNKITQTPYHREC